MARRGAWAAMAITMTAGLAATALTAPAGAVPVAGPEPAGIVVDAVEGLPEDFATGVDVSSVLSLEDSGVVFRDADGNPGDLFDLLADAGVTHVRVRVWNDPYDEHGRGYGGGTVDVPRAVEIGERATAAGMSVLVDLHYSDFWADPAKQQAPKAWADMDADATAAAAGAFTADALTAFADAGVDVTMVQVGNETNNGVAGLTGPADATGVFAAGSAAVREVFPEAKVVVHLTNPETAGRYATAAAALAAAEVDYDVFASSYYPYWHGSLDNLTAVLTEVATTYDKEVMVAETSWAYTLGDGDGHPNVIEEDYPQYWTSPQGQADAYRDVVAAVAAVGDAGIGAFWWEPAWLPVGPPEDAAANAVLWERDGSGWASSFAGDYDEEDAGRYFGGSAWDNQALFAHDGTALESLQIFRYVRTGAIAPREVAGVRPVVVTVVDGDPVQLPEQVTVVYNDRTTELQDVTWDAEALAAVAGPGTYAVPGLTASDHPAAATVTVAERNLLVDGGFEDGGTGWVLDGDAVEVGWSDPRTGERALHWWADAPFTFSATQDVDVEPGEYRLSAYAQGRAVVDGDTIALSVESDEAGDAATFPLSGWAQWRSAEATLLVEASTTLRVRIEGTMTAEAWGTVDDVALVRLGAAGPVDPDPTPTPTDPVPTPTDPGAGEPTTAGPTPDRTPDGSTPDGADAGGTDQVDGAVGATGSDGLASTGTDVRSVATLALALLGTGVILLLRRSRASRHDGVS